MEDQAEAIKRIVRDEAEQRLLNIALIREDDGTKRRGGVA